MGRRESYRDRPVHAMLSDGTLGAAMAFGLTSWPAPPALKATVGRALDFLLPPRALDEAGGHGPVQSVGLTAQAWGRIAFIEAPVCDGCGAPLEYDLGAGARQLGDGRCRRADAAVVGDLAVAVEGDVEVGTDEHVAARRILVDEVF